MTQPRQPPCRPRPQTVKAPAADPVLRLESQSLMGGCREAIIVHQGEEYRLRITRLDKLILTK